MEIKCQLDATEVFIADLIACSTCFGHHYAHHQELKSIIQWLLPVVFHAVVFKLLVWCGAEGYVSGLQRCPKHVEQAIRSAIKTSVASSSHFNSTYDNTNLERNITSRPLPATPEHSQVLTTDSFQSILSTPQKHMTKARNWYC